MANKIEIGVEVKQTGEGMEGIRRRVTDDAKATSQAVDTAFSQAAASSASAFDRLRAGASSAFSRITGDSKSMWDRVAAESRTGADKAGSQAGAGFADNLKEKIGNLDFNSIGGNIGEGLSALADVGGPIGLAAVGIGAVFADDIMTGFTRGFEGNKNAIALQIQTGLSVVETGPIGRAAGEAYAEGFGESLSDLSAAAGILENVLGEIDPSTPLQESIRWASVLEEHFAIDIPRSAEIAGRMIHQGLAENTEDAYDVMIGSAQRYRVAYDEILDVTREFGTTFSELSISGAQAADFVGQAWTRGLVPTIDRAGELFEEFVIEVQTGMSGRAAPAIEAMGLSFAKVQDAISDGRGGEAISQLADQLLRIEDVSYRNELAVQIFGAAIESAADKQAVLELIASLDELGTGFDGAAEDSAAMAESMQTDLDLLKRDIEDLAAGAGNNFAEFYADMAGRGENPWEEIKHDTAEFIGWLHGEFPTVAELIAEGFDGVRVSASRSFNEAEGDALDLAGGLGEAQAATEDLDAAFAQLTGQFSGDQAIRGLHDQIRALGDAELDTTGVTYELGRGFDQTTEAGGTIAAQLEDLHGNLLDVAQAHRDGTATADDLTRAQYDSEAAARAVAAALGLDAEKTAALVAEYASVPAGVHTEITLEGNAFDRVRQIAADLKGLSGQTFTTYLRTATYTTPARVPSRTAWTPSASGGPVAGGLAGGGMSMAAVNDGGGMSGPESAWLPNGDNVMLPTGSKVHSAEDTQRMQSGSGAGQPVVLEINSGGSRLDDFLVELLRKAISNRGGDVQVVLGK